MHISSYLVVTAHAPDELTKSVNLKINEGWQPFGGVSITLTGPRQEGPVIAQSTILAQAVVKP
jgi:hypothetical protein